jgi:multiple sugar transport system substrate-binding protein
LNVLFGGQIIYYNKSMVRKAGLEDPYELWKRGEWTYARFRDHAIKMTAKDARGRFARFGCIIPTFPMTTQVIRAFGGDVLTDDLKRCRLGEPEAIAAYQYLADLRWKDKCAPTPAQSANSQFTFESGKVGMQIEWMGMAPRFRQVIKDFDWDICPVPIGPGGKGMLVKGNQLVMYSGTKHPKEAYRFLRFMTGERVERELYIGHRRSAPTRREIAYSDEFLQSKAPPYQMQTFLHTLENGKPLPINERWSEWTQAANMELDNLFSGRELDAAKVLKRAAAKVDEVLADEEGF